MQLYADPITVNCRKVLAGFDFLGVPYTLQRLDYFAGDHKSAAYTAINPNAALPALVDGDFVLWESNAILQYAADQMGHAAYPREARARADVNRWLLWESSSWFPSCYVYLVEQCVKPLLNQVPDAAVLEAESARFHKLAGILDARLAGSPWLCGDAPTIADFAVAAPLHMRPHQDFPLAEHRHLMRWMTERVEALPCWQRTRIGAGFVVEPALAA